MKKSEQVALCGVVAALCTLLMFMTGMFPFSTYALPALAGLLMVTVAVETGRIRSMRRFRCCRLS